MLESTSLTTNLALHCNAVLGLLEECLSIKHAAHPDEEFYEILFHECEAQSGCQEFWGKITNLNCSLGHMILLDQSEEGQ